MLPLRIHQFSSSTSSSSHTAETKNTLYGIAMLYYLERNEENTKRASNMEWKFLKFFYHRSSSSSSEEGTSIEVRWGRRVKIQQSSNVVRTTRWNTKEKSERRKKYRLNCSRARLLILFAVEDSRKTTNDFSFNISCKLSYFSRASLFLRLFSLSLKCRYLTLKCSLDCLNCTRLYRSFQRSSSFASSPLLQNHGRETFPTRKNSKFSSSSAFQLTHTGEERKVEEKNGKKFPLSFIVSPSPPPTFRRLGRFPFIHVKNSAYMAERFSRSSNIRCH